MNLHVRLVQNAIQNLHCFAIYEKKFNASRFLLFHSKSFFFPTEKNLSLIKDSFGYIESKS